MAVSLFDAGASSKQATLARQEKAKAEGWGGGGLGSAGAVKQMTADQAAQFKNSSFMQQGQQVDDAVKTLMSQKSQELMRCDCTWLPQDSDFTAPKSFKYDKFVDYYAVLGMMEMATQAEIKAAYKRLSLVYHPDKTSGMDDEKKEEYASIFIQLKNAYTTLLDNPTRRQYDWDRCKEVVMCQVCGGKMKTREQFWGFEMNAEKYEQSMQSKDLAPGIDVDIELVCPLERFVYGGQETHWRNRKTRVKGELEDRMKAYHIDVAPGTAEPFVKKFVRKGDEYLDQMADTLVFTLTSKPHDTVERADPDLRLLREVSMGDDVANEPYLSMEVPSILGRHMVMWGRNPFFKNPGGGKELRCALWGLGLRGDGAARFTAVEGGGFLQVGGLRSHPVWEVVGGQDKGGILVRDGKDASAKKYPDRLAFGAYVREVELDGERLYYQRLTDTGPIQGWVATKIPGKDLVVPQPSVVCWEVLGGEELGGIIVREGKDSTSEQIGRLKKGSFVRQLALDGDFLQYELVQDLGEGPQTGWVNVAGELEKKPEAETPKEEEGTDPSLASMPEAIQRRAARWAEGGRICEVDMTPFTEPLGLFTNPGCAIQFYSNLSQAAQVPAGQIRPRPMFGCLISSMSCSSEDNKAEWGNFKASFVAVLKETCFKAFLRLARNILPRPLPPAPVFPEAEYGQVSGGAARAVPWERLGDGAFGRGDVWHAAVAYSQALADVEEGSEAAAGLLSKRADCYATLGEAEAALADARRAAELAPSWAKPWGQVGFASAMLEETAETLQASVDAYSRAVELEPCGGDVDALHGVVGRLAAVGDAKTSEDEQKRGAEAMSKGQYGVAVAAYTSAISRVQPSEDAALTYAVLFGNRSAAFAQLKMWGSAIGDAEKAIEAKKEFPKAHARLGVALLGSGQCEKAYTVFAHAVKLDGSFTLAREGVNSCLVESLRMCSVPARNRKARFNMDQWRPNGSTRVFGCSDVHFDIRVNEEWVHNIDGLKFQDDVLIVAGDMADTFHQICRGLGMLKSKFRRVFYTPGCHDLWIPVPEMNSYQDSIVKLHAILEACDAMGIDIAPAPVCQEVFVVPLFSWYSCVFDEKDPFPDADVDQNPFCRWPIDKDEQVWKFFMTMNESYINLPYHGTVMTFSHVLPRRDLPYWTHIYHQAKFIGCTEVDDQLRKINSKCHVFGRSHRRYGRELDGVIYVNMPLGKEDERMEDFPPLMLVYDREKVCAKEWGINDEEIANPTLAAIEINHYGMSA